MSPRTVSFGSDNHSGAHPRVLEALGAANVGHTGAYGDDPWTRRACEILRETFGPQTDSVLVANGTGANIIALQSCLPRPWNAVVCTDCAHINVDEGGAPERILNSKLVDLPAIGGRLTADQLALTCARLGDEHAVQPSVVSLTQSTEYGTVYSVDEAAALAAEARRLGLFIHVDGARLANAAVSLGLDLRQTAEAFDADVISFGGTKNGLVAAEAVIFRNQRLAEQALWTRKATTQLISKHRFLAVQVIALLTDDLWRHNATNANLMAARLADGLRRRGVEVTQDVQANAVFAVLPAAITPALQEQFHFYVWTPDTNECRLMCSWDTTAEDVDALLAAVDATQQ